MFKGKRGDYYWVEWQEGERFLNDLLSKYPQLVKDKHLVNTSFDSGPLTLSAEETAEGWRKYGELAVSPVISEITDIPNCCYDEWYVFASPPVPFDDHEVFVNWGGFSLHDPLWRELQERFWRQLEQLAPESYLAEGDHLICVTVDRGIFDEVAAFDD